MNFLRKHSFCDDHAEAACSVGAQTSSPAEPDEEANEEEP